eukprot:Tbor_TRINITY_DN3707_c0_g1::TRINITY_DN3707_c0_g1_i1::g.2350::m.2350
MLQSTIPNPCPYCVWLLNNTTDNNNKYDILRHINGDRIITPSKESPLKGGTIITHFNGTDVEETLSALKKKLLSPSNLTSTDGFPHSFLPSISSIPLDASVLLYQGEHDKLEDVHNTKTVDICEASSDTNSRSILNGGYCLKLRSGAGTPVLLDILSLHSTLLPPSTLPSTEEQCRAPGSDIHTSLAPDRSGTHEGYKLLEDNWATIAGFLFPTFRWNTIDYSGNEIPPAAAIISDKDGSMSALCMLPVCSPLSVDGYFSIRRDASVMDRFHYSYMCLLAFYGWRLHDETTGELDRHKKWKERYDKLSKGVASEEECGKHHYITLTHVLHVLLEMKLFSYVKRFILFLMDEFAANRLLFLKEVPLGHHESDTKSNMYSLTMGIFDRCWLPMALNATHTGGIPGIDDDAKALLVKRRARLDESDSE